MLQLYPIVCSLHYASFNKLIHHESVVQPLYGELGLMARSKGKMYMIVGLKTFSDDTKVSMIHKRGLKAGAKFALPLGSAFGLPVESDPTIDIGYASRRTENQHFTTVGEPVYAMEYKIITQRNLLSSLSKGSSSPFP